MPDAAGRAPLPAVSRDHLEELTGELGILQHAIGSVPDPAHGYCVDDVARALQVDLLHSRVLGWPAVADSARRNLAFLEAAFDDSSGRFRNLRAMDGSWTAGIGSEDSHGRALLALGETIAAAPDPAMTQAALTLWNRALPAAGRLTALRAQASSVLGCAAVLSALGPDDGARAAAAAMLESLASWLHTRFRFSAASAWPWPEPALTYENALLPRALIVAGRQLDSDPMLQSGLRALDWLIDIQTSSQGRLSPIGNGWWPRGGERSRFDQQPIEATALLLAADSAFAATAEPRYRVAAELAYGWFVGENDLGVPVADPGRGAGFDGLTPHGVNTNEGAESTLMWLIALEHIRAMRSTATRSTGAVTAIDTTARATGAATAIDTTARATGAATAIDTTARATGAATAISTAPTFVIAAARSTAAAGIAVASALSSHADRPAATPR